jgi:hypothetical protein
MSQAIIQSIVSQMADAFIAAGFADVGNYFAPDGSDAVSVRVFIDRTVSSGGGNFGGIVLQAPTLSLLLSEIPVPMREALIQGDGFRYALVRMLKQDDAVSTWEVKHVSA